VVRRHGQARVWIGQGDLSRAADWARDRGVSAADEASYLREFDHLSYARLLLAQHRTTGKAGLLDEGVGLLDRLAEAAEKSGRAGDLLEIRMLRALAYDAGGHRPEALQALSRAWAEAPEPECYVRLFLDEGAPMVELLHQAHLHQIGRDQQACRDRPRPRAGPDLAAFSPARSHQRVTPGAHLTAPYVSSQPAALRRGPEIREPDMTITTTTLTRAAGLSAVAAGLLFIAVQINQRLFAIPTGIAVVGPRIFAVAGAAHPGRSARAQFRRHHA
jgi:hypothetical protein